MVLKIAVDTNAYVDFCRGDEEIGLMIKQANAIYLPLITLAELRAGFECGTQTKKNEGKLVHFLNSPRVDTLAADEQTTTHYARLFHQLRHQGTPIPTNDLWIAALVIQHNLTLLSRDKHYDHLPQISRLQY